MDSECTVIDLFCGAGGLSEGFSQAGYESLLGLDCEPWAVKTFEKYHGRTICEKIENVSVSRIMKETHGREVTVLAGGPPCQAFSTIACAKLRSMGHPTTICHPLNMLYKEFFRLVKGIMPKFFVMENVPRMLSIDDGIVKSEIERELKGKYRVSFYKEDVASFGVPQFRKRVLVIGNRLGLENPALPHTHCTPHAIQTTRKKTVCYSKRCNIRLAKTAYFAGRKVYPIQKQKQSYGLSKENKKKLRRIPRACCPFT